jgi:predicted transposase YbfD/YdcC
MEAIQFFDTVPDFRLNRKKLHKLGDILMIALCAVVSGSNDFEEIALYGQEKEAFLRRFLELKNGIPSHDTFTRVFCYLDKKAFGNCLYNWSNELLDFFDFHQINIDGKVIRATGKKGEKKSGICIVSAWASEQKLVLGEEKVNQKSNEKTAIPELLKSLDLENSLVSIDAIATEKKNAELIVEKGGSYLLALKKNNKLAYEQVKSWFDRPENCLQNAKTEEKNGGRLEKRVCYVSPIHPLLDELIGWVDLKSIVRVDSIVEKNKLISNETRYFLSNQNYDAKVFNQVVRNHWSIENSLHWQLDVTLNEDRARNITANAPENLSTLRKVALQLLNRLDDDNSLKNRRKKAGWNDEYLWKILQNLRY